MGAHFLLREHKGHHFRMCGGIAERDNAVDTYRDNHVGSGIKDGRPERTSGFFGDIPGGKINCQTHFFMVPGIRPGEIGA